MNRPVHFEMHTPDPQKTAAFFERVLGWKFQKWEGPQEYWLVSTGGVGVGPQQGPTQPGINGGIMKSKDGQPRTINTVQVENVDDAVKRAVAAGAQVALPKMAIPGVGWLAYCIAPGGNIFGVMHNDQNAK